MADLHAELRALVEACEPRDGDGLTDEQRRVSAAWAASLRALLDRCPTPVPAAPEDRSALFREVVNLLDEYVDPARLSETRVLERFRAATAPTPLRPTAPPTEPGRYYALGPWTDSCLELAVVFRENGTLYANVAGHQAGSYELSDLKWFGPVPMPRVAE